jgi:hypothetical protein
MRGRHADLLQFSSRLFALIRGKNDFLIRMHLRKSAAKKFFQE